MIDNIATQDTPEGVTLTFTPAGIIPRAGAWLIDTCIRLVALAVLGMGLALFGESGMGLYMIVFFLIDWFYMVYFEVYRRGQSIGKKQFNLKVCTDDGMSVSWQTSMIRNALRFADMVLLFLPALFAMLFHPKSKRLGDMVAGTMVVYTHPPTPQPNIKRVTPKIPPLPLYFDEQQAILAFAERLHELPPSRQQELALILSPLTKQTDPKKCTDDIVAYANAIIGNDT